MPELESNLPTLVDVATRQDPDGSIARIVEVLAQSNPIVDHAPAYECNNGTSHVTTIRTGLPEPAYRRFNEFVKPSKTTTAQVTDTTAMLEDYGNVDKALADLYSNTNAFRFSEESGVREGFSQKVETDVFYGSTAADPKGFMGLDPRFNDPSAGTGDQLVNGGGTGSTNTSVWLVVWGEQTAHLLYPKGTQAGLKVRDLGEDTDIDPNGGGKRQIYQTHYKWDIGFCVRDWGGIVRICNIDVNALTADAATGANLIRLMIDAQYRIPARLKNAGKVCWYGNRDICTFLHQQTVEKSVNTLAFKDIVGKDGGVTKPMQMHFGMAPIFQADALLSTEAAITFS